MNILLVVVLGFAAILAVAAVVMRRKRQVEASETPPAVATTPHVTAAERVAPIVPEGVRRDAAPLIGEPSTGPVSA